MSKRNRPLSQKQQRAIREMVMKVEKIRSWNITGVRPERKENDDEMRTTLFESIRG